jgi:hypothetical protein
MQNKRLWVTWRVEKGEKRGERRVERVTTVKC